MNAVNNLPQMIREAIEQRDLTYRAIAQRAQAAGYTLSHSTVSVYATGKSRQYSREKLEAIAVGLGISKDTFTSSAHMPTLGAPFELPAESAMLDPHERDAVRRVVEAFIETKTRREAVGHSDDTSMYQAGGRPADDDSKVHRAEFAPDEHDEDGDNQSVEERYGKPAYSRKEGVAHDVPLEEQ